MNGVWTQDEIAAFINGRLHGADAERIAMALEQDPAAQAAAERLAAGAPPHPADALLRDAFAAPMEETVPARLAAAVLAEPGKVASLPRRGGGGARRAWAPAAMAAGVALALGFGAGFSLRGPADPAPQAVAEATLSVGPAAGAALAAFETAASGAERDGLRLAASFRDAAGRACREFEALDAGGLPAAAGVACREGGGWRVLAMAAVAAASVAPADGGYAPAGGDGADALGAMLDALGAGPALSPEEEAAMIAGGWR
jgi:hypothetical protein